MGAEPYQYIVPYQEDMNKVLSGLREKVFKEGNYRGSELNPSTMEEAVENMMADGTCSILDITRLSDEIEMECLAPLDNEALIEIFGTEKPTLEMVKENEFDIYGWIDRGEAVYITVYKDGKRIKFL